MKKIKILMIMVILVAFNSFAQVSVIANKSVSENISVPKTASIFSIDITKWSNGAKITVFDNTSDVKSSFYGGIGKDVLSLKKEWMKKQLTGEAKAPESLGSDSDVISKVASTPGAIGFVKSSSVSGSVNVILELK
jgi:ABC-type phosphate transport system substrate-binding protein